MVVFNGYVKLPEGNVFFVASNLDLSMGQKPLYPMHGLHIKKKTCCYRCSFRPFMWQAIGFETV